MSEIPKNYNPTETEPRILEFWEKEDIFKFDSMSENEIFSIDNPPPTVSGNMHIGHAFSYSQIDFIARYHRMRGKNIFMPFGTDDNGLPTERLVEKINKVKSSKMDRLEFIDLCMKTLDSIKGDFIDGWKRIGISADWNISYSTIDENCRKISQKHFIDLYKKKRVYRKKAPFLWCPGCQTAIAQVEMKDKKQQSNLNFIKSKILGMENTYVIYATTRPELLFGCVGMSVEDTGKYVMLKVGEETWITGEKTYKEKFKDIDYKLVKEITGSKLIGKECEIPVSKIIVKIDNDISVKSDYGTGIVYFCTYGGIDCIEWMSRREKMKPIELLNKNGTLNNKSNKYEGMNVKDARDAVLNDMKKSVIMSESIEHVVNTHERCDTEIEILITSQWFIKYIDMKKDFLKAGEEMNWNPKFMKSRYDNWIKGLKWDWCISRQRYFGVPFPVWYDKKTGETIVADEKDLPVDPIKDDRGMIPEKDVLDTWATSSLTPKITASLFPSIKEKLYPMSLRPQSHDIITFWLFNTVVRSVIHDGVNPWKDIMISGWALDPKGRKMSKSKGNVVEPKEVIEKHSADSLRFWASDSRLGDNLSFQEKEIITGTKTINKLWNLCKFVSILLGDEKPKRPKKFTPIDKWMLSNLSKSVKICTEGFETYRYHKSKHEVENLLWNIFADYYVEIIKHKLYNKDEYDEEEINSTKYTLYSVFYNIVKMFAPIMPFVTEEIYRIYFKKNEAHKSIHISEWPEKMETYAKSETLGSRLIEVISSVRKFKTQSGKSMNEEISKITISDKDLKIFSNEIKNTLKSKKVSFGKNNGTETESGIKVFIEA